MPNHVTNSFLYVSDKEKFKKLAINSGNEIDFEIIEPTPKDLKITTSGLYREYENDEIILSVMDYIKANCQELSQDEVTENVLKLVDRRKLRRFKKYNASSLEYFENIVRAMYNKQKYGYEDWYNFQCEEWGTKWNAYDQYVSEDLTCIEFHTAWSSPYAWLEKLAKEIDFTLVFADEDTGSNCGIVYTENHKIKVVRIDREFSLALATVFSLTVQGCDIREYADMYEEADEKEYADEIRGGIKLKKHLDKQLRLMKYLPFSNMRISNLACLNLVEV